ncbi:MAG: DUF2892 domain-containing protein [Acidobacteria bacterium]|nr:DUF2892 domain-containing protein [Acidobacteriota bacterium]
MTIERALRLIAGIFVLASLALGIYVSRDWFILTAVVGFMLLQSGLTNWCPMMFFLRVSGICSRKRQRQ